MARLLPKAREGWSKNRASEQTASATGRCPRRITSRGSEPRLSFFLQTANDAGGIACRRSSYGNQLGEPLRGLRPSRPCWARLTGFQHDCSNAFVCPPNAHTMCVLMPANKNNIRSGMRVVLQSGGLVLTVRAVSGDQAYCEWFEGAERRQGTFALVTLQPADSDNDSTNPASAAG